MTLDQIAIKYQTDKASTHHGYTKYYERHFEELRNESIKLIELGYGGYEFPDRGGAGAKMWLEYFPNAKILSIDIHKKTNIPSLNRYWFIQSSQDNPLLADNTVLAAPDIIIDDASHVCDLTLKSFEILFPILNPGGWYVIEDIEGSYFDGWSNGTLDYHDMDYYHPVNLARHLVNHINVKYIPNCDLDNDVEEIHFYQNIIFIKKK
jgi:hypothetical protein